MSFIDNIKYNHETQMAMFEFEFGHIYSDQGDAFFSIYKIEQMLVLHDTKQNKLKQKQERICRFCGKSLPDVTFKNKAHLIPQFLGNKNLLSDFECDICNTEFGCNESELAYYIGLTRTLTRLTGKEVIPKFKSPDERFSTWIDENNNITYSESERGENVTFDDENKIITFKFPTHSFNALKVYKCLVKIALSIIKTEDIVNFKKSIDFLKDDNITEFDNSLAAIHEYVIPGPFLNYTILFSCIKKENIVDNLIPSRTFILCFRNYMIQYFIPLDLKDTKVNEPGINVKMGLLPPLVNQKWINRYGQPTSELIRLSKNERINSREEIIKIKYE